MRDCPWPGCRTRVPDTYWGCGKHWFKLPEELRGKLRVALALPETDTKRVEVEKEVQDWIKDNVR